MLTSTLVLVKNKTINCAYVIFDLSWSETYNTQKNLSVVFASPKNPHVFHRPKKNPFWTKCQTQKNPSDLPVIKYVSVALGVFSAMFVTEQSRPTLISKVESHISDIEFCATHCGALWKFMFEFCFQIAFGSWVWSTGHIPQVKSSTNPSINYKTTQIPLDLREHFLNRLGLGDTFNSAYLPVS